MKKKLLGIFVCTLLIATVIPMSASLAEDKSNNLPPEGYALKQKGAYREVHLDRGWDWIPSYPNYAPSGMPDFYQRQNQWQGIIDGGDGIADSTAVGDDVQVTPVGGIVDPNAPAIIAPGPNCNLESTPAGDDHTMWMFSYAVSTANCFWWLDSKYGDPDGFPGDGEDNYPLVTDYGAGDDHATDNAPLFIETMANALNITSTLYLNDDVWINTIEDWLVDAGLENMLELNFYTVPTFDFIAGEIEQDKAVILVVNFVNDTGEDCEMVGSHAVTCAGVNLEELEIAICDPYWDIDNPSGDDHNDAQYVSHDIYDVAIGSPCSNYPEIEWWLPSYWPDDYNYSVIYNALVIEYINNPPETPAIDGPTSGNVGTPYTYTFNSEDPDEDEVYYYIKWDDGYVEVWDGPHASGVNVDIEHTYTKQGTFTIEAKAKDICDAESGWGTFEVTMPRNRLLTSPLFMRLLERFPNAFPILRQLLVS